ncbi:MULTISPECIES: alpha-1,3-galactosidase-related protein [Dysgonomonas]|uniref:alpha-1,3-galactosidase-related protein n=1 Tax=Dysgonomonas TaxID=156973 RepID=UPI000927AE7A|nr:MULTISPECIES: right-handed parallel beta-helix repeat-containing protein [Dysgonomonas]MBN9300221.1 right-handed parallel beta-helix repeat-containing protein [Dysgonomonas mossii]OJX59467.1 MAG: hypothetical protein BGO84_11995 [Dysgonomonas sp. 37-18]
MRIASIVLTCLLIVNYFYAQEVQTIRIPNTNQTDYTSQVREALENTPESDLILEFEKGSYHFYPEEANGLYINVSNNDNGYKRVAFLLDSKRRVEIKGQNSEFVFHGEIVPFYIKNSRNVTLSGISLDYDKSFIFEGEVIANNEKEKSIDIKVSSNTDYRIRGARLFFGGYKWEKALGENIVFDPKTRAPYYYTSKYSHLWWPAELQAKDLGDNCVRLLGFNSEEVPPVGSIYTDKGPHGENRTFPGIIIHSSSDVILKDVNVYMSGGMALIGENSENISLDNYNVKLRENSGRIISASADASHFVNCRGLIKFDNCLFENMLDDATNVHGTYMPIRKSISDHCIAVAFGHYQQEGFDFASEGDTLRIIYRNNLQPQQVFRVKEIEKINDNYYLIHSADKLESFPENGNMAVENLSGVASVEMKNCTVRNNRARSILISTSKPVLIENNYFDSMMAGILIAGDANSWFESGNVGDVVIRGNTFVNIGKGGEAPQSVLQISPEIPKENRKDGYYHGKIVFEDNIVKTFDSQVIYALSVKSLEIKNNKFFQTKDYKPIYKGLSFIDIQNCQTVEITDNSYEGDFDAEISAVDCVNVKTNKQRGFKKSVVEKPNTFFYQQ